MRMVTVYEPDEVQEILNSGLEEFEWECRTKRYWRDKTKVVIEKDSIECLEENLMDAQNELKVLKSFINQYIIKPEPVQRDVDELIDAARHTLHDSTGDDFEKMRRHVSDELEEEDSGRD